MKQEKDIRTSRNFGKFPGFQSDYVEYQELSWPVIIDTERVTLKSTYNLKCSWFKLTALNVAG